MKLLPREYFTLFIHVLIWSLLLGIPTILFRDESVMDLPHGYYFFSSLFHIGLFYFNAYFLYPKLLTRKRWLLYIPALFATIMLATRVKLLALHLDPAFHFTAQNRRVIFFGAVPFVVASILYRLISDRIRFERLEKEARAERLAAELKFLRSQISPHFLFNTMTNMVSLARKKSDLMEPSLIKLSDLLRYMLYDSIEGSIPVSAEIEQLQNYIGLQQLRFGEDVKLELYINDDCPGCRIEPMLLVPFIENAYKHGIGMVEDPYIKIKIAVTNKILNFFVENNYNIENHSKDRNTGIGLENVKNRLKYLYAEKYDLTITDNGNIFSVYLKLDLS